MIAKKSTSLENRLLSKRFIDGNGCWIWKGCVSHGYGQLGFNGRTQYVHRLAAKVWHNDYEEFAHYCHKNVICKDTRCFNPDHIYKGDRFSNMRDLVLSGKHYNIKKTSCVHGHEFTKINTGINKRGNRYCKACLQISNDLNRWR